jgi:ABC-2 type transport system ATP-binding protein
MYPVAKKEPGLAGTLRHFWHREFTQIHAVQDVSFTIEPGEVWWGSWAPMGQVKPPP